MIEIRHMQAAVAVADELNFSRAANRVGVTQPALSKQIAELEEHVGCSLFIRSSQNVEVTAAGAAFVEHARVALLSLERAVHSARAAALGSDTILMIGQSPNIDPYITSTMHSVRLPLFPNLELRFSSHYSSDALKLLRSGEIDLAVVIGIHEDASVSAMKISEEPFYVALPSSDPLSAKKELRVGDLADRRLALFERQVNPPVHDRFQKVLADDHVIPAEIQYFIQPEEAANLLLQRDSLALLLRMGAWRISDGSITIRPLRDERLLLRTYLAARSDDKSRLVSKFVQATVKRLSPHPRQAQLELAV
jgi:DNA-binding transcriptional LysR family regulator